MEEIRRMDDLGRILIPKNIRKAIGWGENTPIIIRLEDNKIVLTEQLEVDNENKIGE